MAIILDSCIWVDIERGNLAPADVASITGDESVYLTPIVVAELEYGVNRAANASSLNKRASALIRIKHKPCLMIDIETAIIFGRLAADVDKRSKPSTYRTHDLWIAALAIQHNMAVLTRNRKDFEGIPGIKILVI